MIKVDQSTTLMPEEVVSFWCDAGTKAWFRRDNNFDEIIRSRFGLAHLEASRGSFEGWRQCQDGALALILLLDQFPRHIYRASAHAFATDPLARDIADHALRTFQPTLFATVFLSSFEHHEDSSSQVWSLELFRTHAKRTGNTGYVRLAELHAEIIARFGRFPHRNRFWGGAQRPRRSTISGAVVSRADSASGAVPEYAATILAENVLADDVTQATTDSGKSAEQNRARAV